jgi:hypothetical protein
VRPPFLNAADDCLLDARVLIETQKAVRAEVDDAMTRDDDFPAGPRLVNHEILHVRIGEERFEMLHEARDAVLLQSLAKTIDWEGHDARIHPHKEIQPGRRPAGA